MIIQYEVGDEIEHQDQYGNPRGVGRVTELRGHYIVYADMSAGKRLTVPRKEIRPTKDTFEKARYR